MFMANLEKFYDTVSKTLLMVDNGGAHLYLFKIFQNPEHLGKPDITNIFHERDTWMIMGKTKPNQKAQKINYFALTK